MQSRPVTAYYDLVIYFKNRTGPILHTSS